MLFACVSCTERRQLQLLESAEQQISEGKAVEGAETIRRAIAVDPESRTAVKGFYRLGFTLETYLKDFESAVQSYEQFIKHSGDAVSVYEVQKRISNLYFEQLREPEKAIEGYQKLLLISPESLEADFFHYRIAQAEFRLNNFSASRERFQKLLEAFPKTQFAARARYGIGNTYFMEGRYDVSIEALKQVLRHHPGSEISVESQFLMAQSLEHEGKLPAALQMYESLKEKYPVREVLNLRIEETARRNRQQSKK